MGRRPPLSPDEYLGLRVAVALAFGGFLIAGVLLLNHLLVADAAFCGVGDWFSCNTVNRSPYSAVGGVPVALLGALGFLALAALATARLTAPRSALGRRAPALLTLTVAGGLAFGGYLLAVELAVLHQVCLLCAAALALFVAAALALRHTLVLPGRARPPEGGRRAPARGG